MISVLIDYNDEGHAALIWTALSALEWNAFNVDCFRRFRDVNLSPTASDREIYRFAQAHGMLLLTGNRNNDGPDSLEQTLQDERTDESLPVLTIANMNRIYFDSGYRADCATRIEEIAWKIEDYRGFSRIFIP